MSLQSIGVSDQRTQRNGITSTIQEVDITADLRHRPKRRANRILESRAMAALAEAMAKDPRSMLQRLAESALELCRADTAGISLLEGDVFRWEAVAGVHAAQRNGTMPWDASPRAACLQRDETRLMRFQDRCFPALQADPPFVEALLIPFRVNGRSVGTVWIVSHEATKKFDAEDERVVRNLTQFASAGWQLWKACELAEAESRHREEFLAQLGHELRNPLGAITNATSILRSPAGVAVHSAAIEIIGRQTTHISRLVEDLLDVAQIARGKLELRMAPIDLCVVVSGAIETMQPTIEHRHHAFTFVSSSDTIWVEADAVRIQQIVGNLLDNAAKFTPDGGRITLRLSQGIDEVVLMVEDSGAGIPSDKLGSVFKMFEQLGSGQTAEWSGLGLGLTLVRKLAELHGGSVSAESDGVGRGSRFTMRLPRMRSERDGDARSV